MKALIYKFLVSLIVLALALVAGIGYTGYIKFQTPSTNSSDKTIEIAKGSGSLAIADQLKAQGIISDSYVFVVVSKISSPEETLKAGEYRFAPHMHMSDVITKIKRGDIFKRQFTIPEGLTSFEIVERLKNSPDIKVTEGKIPSEGSLLPDTYQYKKNETIDDITARMQDSLKSLLKKEWPLRDQGLPLTTIGEALTLASIVEKETGVPTERKRIAGVFINRLRQGIPLQSDPTVIYALTNGQPKSEGQGPLGRRLLLKDLEVNSPYNTYRNVGLPPAPVANAGRDAILAVLHPEANDFLFFVADGSGGHVFAKTLPEHNRNVAKWREIRKLQNHHKSD